MEEEERNIGSETVPVSSPPKKRTHVERRVNFGDALIKSLRSRDKLYSIGDSKMVNANIDHNFNATVDELKNKQGQINLNNKIIDEFLIFYD